MLAILNFAPPGLAAILAGAGNIVEDFSYTYDVLGNVLTRASDAVAQDAACGKTLYRVCAAPQPQSAQ